MADLNGSNGQAAPDSSGTTGNAPANTDGGSGSTVQTTGDGSVASAVESFFDPNSIKGKPELEAAYKQMQGAWTKAMQKAKSYQPKVDAYDAFERDPMGTMRMLANQYGLQLVQPGKQDNPKDFNPQNWDEVEEFFRNKFREKELVPLQNEIRNLKKQSVEKYLDDNFPDWREHEDSMKDVLKKHPSLVQDPDALYRAAVPSEVWQARATQAAMQKLKQASQNTQVSGGSTTTRPTQQEPSGPLSFDQAVAVAKQRLASRGIRP